MKNKKVHMLTALVAIPLLLGACSTQKKTTDKSSEHSASSSKVVKHEHKKAKKVSNTIKTRDETKIAIMLWLKYVPDDDLTKEPSAGVWENDGKKFVGNGGPILVLNYEVNGDTVKYSKKSQGQYPPMKSISLAELENEFYSTSEQVNKVDQIAQSFQNTSSDDNSEESSSSQSGSITNEQQALAALVKQEGQSDWKLIRTGNQPGMGKTWTFQDTQKHEIAEVLPNGMAQVDSTILPHAEEDDDEDEDY